MRCFWRHQSSLLRTIIAASLMVSIGACGESTSSPPRRFAVLSAFPAELAPHVARATVGETVVIEGRKFRVGTLKGVPVVMALTGIGLLNAAATTHLLLEHFDVQGVIVSAVAGSMQLPIGDVAVPLSWVANDGTAYPAHPPWVELASAIAASGSAALERCTSVPSVTPDPVCMPQPPAIVVGGFGRSTDPFGTMPFACQPKGDDLYGCDVPANPGASPAVFRRAMRARAAADAETPVVDDMETAAIAREVAARGLPFIAFRGVSDGPGDPLALGGFLVQFSAYYHLAARNAAAASEAFLERVIQE